MATRKPRRKRPRKIPKTPKSKADDLKFSKPAAANLFEWFSDRRPDFAGLIPRVDRRRDRKPAGKSSAGRPRDPDLAGWRFVAEHDARLEFGAARDLRDARKIAACEGTSIDAVLLAAGMSAKEVRATIEIGLPVLKRAGKSDNDTGLRRACGLTARSRPMIGRAKIFQATDPAETVIFQATDPRGLREAMRRAGVHQVAVCPACLRGGAPCTRHDRR